jgi:hypothetical protein
MEYLERDGAIVAEVLGEVDRSHAPASELALDAVAVSQATLELLAKITHPGTWVRGRDPLNILGPRRLGSSAEGAAPARSTRAAYHRRWPRRPVPSGALLQRVADSPRATSDVRRNVRGDVSGIGSQPSPLDLGSRRHNQTGTFWVQL